MILPAMLLTPQKIYSASVARGPTHERCVMCDSFVVETPSFCCRNIQTRTEMEDAKKIRTGSKTAFTRTEGSLLDALKVPQLPQATLLRRFDDLKAKWEHCQTSHDRYAEFAGDMETDEVDALEGWIGDLANRFNDIESKTDIKNEGYQIVTPASLANANVSNPMVHNTNVPPRPPKSVMKIEPMKYPSFKGVPHP